MLKQRWLEQFNTASGNDEATESTMRPWHDEQPTPAARCSGRTAAETGASGTVPPRFASIGARSSTVRATGSAEPQVLQTEDPSGEEAPHAAHFGALIAPRG